MDKKRTIYEIFGTDAHEMTKALMEAAVIAEQIPQGASIALKPNLILAASPEGGATTHAGVLSGCIEWSSVNITDNKSENPLKPCASRDRVYLTYSQV